MTWLYKKMKNNYIYSITVFSITVVFTLILYKKLGITPFGNNTLMIWDMELQYSSFLTWLREAILGKEDWKYSFIGGYGGNALGLISYYLASPLNLLLVFFNISTIHWGILMLTLIKSGLMSVTMQKYLCSKRNSLDSVWFGCAYALSSYVICYQSNIMWMDGLILLPCIVRGIEKLVEFKQGKMYAISLGIAIISNYYIGYMLCIFSVIYFLAYLYIYKREEVGNKVKSCFFFAYYSLIAGGLSAFLILPTIYTLSLSSNKRMLDISALLRQEKFLEYIRLIPFSFAGTFNEEQGILGNYPLIYCGSVFVFLGVLFFISKGIKIKEKIFYGIIISILLFSFGYSGIYLIWHGCYEPVGSPWRFSFLWVFMILTIGYEGLKNIGKEKISTFLAFGVLVGIIGISCLVYGRKKLLLINLLVIILIYVLLMISSKTKSKIMNIIMFGGIVFSLGGELIYNGVVIHQRQFPGRYEKIEEYSDKIGTIGKLLEVVDGMEQDNSLYRVEIIDAAARNNNDGYLYNQNTLTMYSSTEKAFAWNIFYNWGWGEPGIHAKYSDNTTNLARSISGVRYILSTKELENNEIELVQELGEVKLYRNKIAMPFAFLVNHSALNIANEKSSNFIQFQNDMYHGLLGSLEEDIYQKIREERSNVENKLEKKEDYLYSDGQSLYSENIALLRETIINCSDDTLKIESVKDSEIRGVFVNDTKEEQLVCFSIPYEKAWKATVDGKKIDTYEGMGGFLLVPIGSGKHVIELEYEVPLMTLGSCLTLVCVILCIIDKRKRDNIEVKNGI